VDAVLRLRHAVRLVSDVVLYSSSHRAWWLLLVAPIIALAVLAVTTTQAAVPYAVYTLF
jgi:hypothetical protein